jgi:hypothetical protein
MVKPYSPITTIKPTAFHGPFARVRQDNFVLDKENLNE